MNHSGGRTESPITGPLHYTHHVASPHSDTSSQHDRTVLPTSHRIQVSSTGERLYGVGATWDFIQNHELFRKGMVDITEISQRIQPHALCDGTGPAYPESEIIKAIEDSVSGAGDELI